MKFLGDNERIDLKNQKLHLETPPPIHRIRQLCTTAHKMYSEQSRGKYTPLLPSSLHDINLEQTMHTTHSKRTCAELVWYIWVCGITVVLPHCGTEFQDVY